MKILIVHQHYLFPGEPGGSRFNAFSAFWTRAGHSVEVIAGNLNYATGNRPAGLQPRFVQARDEEGVRVWRCHVPASYSRSFAGRMWAFFGFTVAASLAALRVSRPDVIIATSPPLTAVVPGWIASRFRLRRVPWIFEMRDLWPESAITTGVIARKSLIARVLYRLERWASRKCDRINVLTPAFAEDLVERGLAPREKIAFISNGADLDDFEPGDEPELRARLGWEAKVVALYAGAHGLANALHQLVDAAGHLRSRPDVLIVAVGDGPERSRLQAMVEQRKLTNIVFMGPRPKDEMPALVRACDIGLAVLQNNVTFRTVYPNKVFDYMACSRPSVVAIDGIARKLVCEDARAGLFAEPENGADLARVIGALADDAAMRRQLGASGREWVVRNASRERLAAQYLEVMTGVAGR